MVEGVVVAGGFSSRAGGWKMAFDLGGLTVLQRCVLTMSSFCSRVIVVGGDRYRSLPRLLSKEKYPLVELVYNADYPQGMFSSVLTGFREVRAPRFFFIPGDYPLVSPSVYRKLLSQEGEAIIPSYQGDTGHPVLFQTAAITELTSRPGKYNNLREFIASRQHQYVEVADPGILLDIDTREDYQKASRHLEATK